MIWAFWHNNDLSDQYVVMQDLYWQGGTVSRVNRNGACIRLSCLWDGGIQNTRFLRGSPHLWMDAPEIVLNPPGTPSYTTGSFANYAGVSRAVGCRGYDGGSIGCFIGETGTRGTAFTNGHCVLHCYFEGDGSSGSVGLLGGVFGTGAFFGCTLKDYNYGLKLVGNSKTARVYGTKMINVTQPFFGELGSFNQASIIHPRGWQSGRGNMTCAARDAQGLYLGSQFGP